MIKEFFKLVGSVLAVLGLVAFVWLLLLPISFGHGIWSWIANIVAGLIQAGLLYWLYKKMHAGKKETDDTLRF